MKKTILSILSIGLFTATSFGQTQPPNIGFEEWEELDGSLSNTYWEPEEWSTSNQCTELLNATPVTQSSDAYQGASSARLETLDGPGEIIVMNGVITTANMICLASSGGQEGGINFPSFGGGVRSFPDSLVGWYKYAPIDNDSAYSQIMFLANNEQDTVCFTRLDYHAQAEWTRFSVAICPGNTDDPEILSLLFSSSWGDGAAGEGEIGSVFYLDAIEFIYPLDISVGNELADGNWSVYPNPASDVVNVRSLVGEKAKIEILDVTGKTVMVSSLNSDNTRLELSTFLAGVYLYQIRSTENEVLRTGKLFVNH